MPTFLSFELWKPRLARDLRRLVKRRLDPASLRAARVLEPDACVLGLAGPLRVRCVPRRLDREEDRGFGCSTKEIDPRLRWAVIGQFLSVVFHGT